MRPSHECPGIGSDGSAEPQPGAGARPGAVRDAIAAQQREWLGVLERLAREAGERGELEPGTDPVQLAFELQALLVAANTSFILQGDASTLQRARNTIRERLQDDPRRRLATAPAR